MAEPKGDKLYVNLGASQTRRRLKSFGHGVRKVQTAGRNRAVIIHTATGHHLRELEARFADVGYATSEGELGEPIESLRNLGPTSAQWLRDVEIRSIGELRRLGAVEAYQRVKSQQPAATLNLLWALAAALEDRDWRSLSSQEKDALRNQLNQLLP